MRTIQNEVKEIPGVVEVKADVITKLVTVNWNDSTSWDAVQAKLEEIEYPPAESISGLMPA